jgi:hypothetical protein
MTQLDENKKSVFLLRSGGDNVRRIRRRNGEQKNMAKRKNQGKKKNNSRNE